MAEREIIQRIANILEIQKVSWSRAMKACRTALEDGFTEEDLVEAAYNMRNSDKKYWSLYSVFLKADYWYSKKDESEKPKGAWSAD